MGAGAGFARGWVGWWGKVRAMSGVTPKPAAAFSTLTMARSASVSKSAAVSDVTLLI